MSHCKACDVPLNSSKKWKPLTKSYTGDPMPDTPDDLCELCRDISVDCFLHSLNNPAEEEELIRRQFHYGHRSSDEDVLTSLAGEGYTTHMEE